MSFYFDSFQAFLAMGGHGLYVWLSYFIVLIGLTVLVVSPVAAKKRFLKQQKQILIRQGSQNQRDH